MTAQTENPGKSAKNQPKPPPSKGLDQDSADGDTRGPETGPDSHMEVEVAPPGRRKPDGARR